MCAFIKRLAAYDAFFNFNNNFGRFGRFNRFNRFGHFGRHDDNMMDREGSFLSASFYIFNFFQIQKLKKGNRKKRTKLKA